MDLGNKKRSRSAVNAETKRFVPWCISPLNLFLIHAPLEELEVGIQAELLAEVTPGGELRGNYRWSVSGKSLVKMSFPLSQVLPLADADCWELTWETRTSDIIIPTNRSAGAWEDLTELVSQGKIIVTKDGADGANDLIGKLPNFHHPFTYC